MEFEMCQQYRQLNSQDRFKIYYLLLDGFCQSEIARQLNFHRSTISREIKRNSNKHGYTPGLADKVAVDRRYHKRSNFTVYPWLKEYVVYCLKAGWSPEQISGRLRLKYGKSVIAHETIYRFIYSDEGAERKLYLYLCKKKRARKRRGSRGTRQMIPNRTSIHERPTMIEKRSSFGHWEGDLILFKKGVLANIITLRERKSRYIVTIKNENRRPKETATNIINHMCLIKEHIKSLTLDNGIEFKEHCLVADHLNLATYFCDPYKSFQKGSVENGNRLLRTPFPRDLDISAYTQEYITSQTNKINNKPMKCLGYKTPTEVFHSYTGTSLICSNSD